MTQPHAVRIAKAQSSAALSKGQKTFNKLIKQIEEHRKLLQDWQNAVPLHRAKLAAEYEPLLPPYNQAREKLARLFDAHLDAHLDAKGLTKTERAKLADLIVNITDEVLGYGETPELIALYDKHSGISYAEETDLAKESAMAMVEDIFGVDLGDAADFDSPADMAQRLHEMTQEQAQQQAERQATQKPRKPTAKALAREARQKEEAQHASQSIREVFRKLASALHPDREPEPAERERKTELMQRVNTAYQANDLLTLLRLQLEIEQINPNDIAGLSEQRLKHYNQVLTEQLNELRDEVDFIEAEFDDDPFSRRRPHPALLMQNLNNDIADLRRATAGIEKELRALQDIKALKAMLRTYQIQRHDPFFDDDFSF